MKQENKIRAIVTIWKQSLAWLLAYYDRRRGKLIVFFPRLFIFFFIFNILCYWLAILTAYPEAAFGNEKLHYFFIQFPIGFLGASFDSLSFFVTVFLAKRALKTTSTTSYIAHLGVDLIIAIIATWWILFVFSFSGWLVSWIQHNPESLGQRNYVYEQRLVEAVQHPTGTRSLKNIYFGLVMGISSMLPTVTHLTTSAYSVYTYLKTSKSR